MAKKDPREMHSSILEMIHYIKESDQKINELMMMHVHSSNNDDKAKALRELKKNQEDIKKRFIVFMVQFSLLGDRTITNMGFEVLKSTIEGFKKEEDIVNRRFNELNVAKRKIDQSDDHDSVKRSKKEGIDLQKGLTDIIMEMYGFTRERAESIERRFQKVVNKASKNEQREVIDLNEMPIDIDPLEDYKSEVPVDCEGLDKDLAALRSQDATKMEERFKALKTRIFSKDQQNVYKNSETQESDSCDEVCEILEVIRNWVLHLETDIICIMNDLCSLISNNDAAVAKFQQFKSVLEELKNKNGGLVPVVVYQILSLLEMPYSATMEDKNCDDTHGKDILCIQFDLEETISHLKLVLNTSGPTNTQPIRMGTVITLCEHALKHSREKLRQIELKIKKLKAKLRESEMKKLAKQNWKVENEGEDAEKGPEKDEADKENKEIIG